jgi:cytochrome c553
MKWLKRILLALLVLFLVAQFVRPSRANPPVDTAKELRAPANVQQILDRSCNDCHSNRTQWPWYSNVTPVSWYLVDHIKDGRRELNLSEFNSYRAKRQARKMEELCKEVEEGEMPLREYVWLHPEARLSEQDRQTLCTWAKEQRAAYGLRQR